MMKRKHFRLAALCIAAMCVVSAASGINVYPEPHSVVATPKASVFAIPSGWKAQIPASLEDTPAIAALRHDSLTLDDKDGMPLILATRDMRTAKRYAIQTPDAPESYFLEVTPKKVVIVGSDERGLLYGVKTFLSLLKGERLEPCKITDGPDVAMRGVVEGFYGTPWSHNARMRMLTFLADNKMNTYIYGPKDDPFHRDRWREDYPAEEGKRISELASHAAAEGVDFYWAIHPGASIKWDGTERMEILNKFGKMYDLGVRAFAVFFDDISGEGTKALKQAELLNYIDDEFIAKHPDVKPLVMCPTRYSKGAATGDESYLPALKEHLNDDIYVMWTGDRVLSEIDKASLEWVNPRIGRKAFVWWNFPVSDYVRDHLLLGPVYGNGLDIAPLLSGFVSNPMEYPEASRIAVGSVGEYLWNMDTYNAEEAWRRSIAALLPSAAKELEIFALYNKAPGKNWDDFDREEGDELLSIRDAALTGDTIAIEKIAKKCCELKRASDILLGDTLNRALIDELRPWLLQARNIADYGTTVCQLAVRKGCIHSLKRLAEAQRRHINDYEKTGPLHFEQPGIKVGSKVLLPMLDKLYEATLQRKKNAHK